VPYRTLDMSQPETTPEACADEVWPRPLGTFIGCMRNGAIRSSSLARAAAKARLVSVKPVADRKYLSGRLGHYPHGLRPEDTARKGRAGQGSIYRMLAL
jgi:hypothetical protein